MLRRTPGVAAAAVVALALGIGANTAIFSVVDGVLLRPLPFRDSRALVMLERQVPAAGPLRHRAVGIRSSRRPASRRARWRAVGAYASGDIEPGRRRAARPMHVAVGLGSATLFPTLGVAPIIGRNFTPDEELKGSDQVALLDHGLWERRFGSDPSIVGKTLRLDGCSYKIIGVLPAGFRIDGDTRATCGFRWPRTIRT